MEMQAKIRLVDTGGGKRRWDELKEYHGNKYITMCKIESQWEFAM